MQSAKISSKGQLTLPQKVRKSLGLGKGDQLSAEVKDGEMIMRPLKYKDLDTLFSAFKSERYVSDQDIKEVVKSQAQSKEN